MKFGSLFSGIGGIDLGLERAGMECAWQVEIDLYCQKILAKHWPDVKRLEDVRECGAHNLEAVDLICGGFPCQPHSLAGKRGGEGDDRNLWPEYRRIVAELRPRWVLGENVPGIRTTMLDTVLSDLEGFGYSTITLDIPAVAFDAPHRRHRYFIVAYTGQQPKRAAFDRQGDQAGSRDEGWQGDAQIVRTGQGIGSANGSEAVAYSNIEGLQDGEQARGDNGKVQAARAELERCRGSWWAIEPDVGRVAYGVPSRMDRIRTLGNAVVPQVAEWIGRRILAADMEIL